MTIAGIVVSISILLFLQLQKYIQSFSGQLSFNNDIILFTNVLHMDIDKAEKISNDGDIVVVQLEQYDVEYEFTDDFVLRFTPDRTDTFRIACKYPEFTFLDNENEIIKSIYFEIPVDKQNYYPVYLYKLYPSQFMFEQDLEKRIKQ